MPPGHRAEAEKKTPPLIAAAILTAANTEFFNSLSQQQTLRVTGRYSGRPALRRQSMNFSLVLVS